MGNRSWVDEPERKIHVLNVRIRCTEDNIKTLEDALQKNKTLLEAFKKERDNLNFVSVL